MNTKKKNTPKKSIPFKEQNSPTGFIAALNGIILSLVMFLFFPAIGAANVTSMYLDPSSKTVNAGDTFSLDLALNNSGGSVFDTIAVWLGYDSTILKVLDALPQSGTQIQTDPQGQYNFGWNSVNSADNTTGEIDWRAGSFLDMNANGVFARIDFEALAQTQSTAIYFKFDNPWTYEPFTKVLNDGADVLLDSDNHTDGASGAVVSVNVVPEPSGIFLFLGGLGWMPFFTILCRRR